MKQLTAVEWLVNEIFAGHTNAWQEEIKKAKQIEKEQMDDAYCQGCKDFIENNIKVGRYYSKIYKK